MNTVSRLFLIAALCGLVLVAGVVAYNAGVAHGVEQGAQVVVPAPAPGQYPYPPYPYPFGWHHHGGFGLFLFPLFFFGFFLFVARGLFGRRRFQGGRGCGPGGRLDEWHRRAHERLGDPLPQAPVER